MRSPAGSRTATASGRAAAWRRIARGRIGSVIRRSPARRRPRRRPRPRRRTAGGPGRRGRPRARRSPPRPARPSPRRRRGAARGAGRARGGRRSRGRAEGALRCLATRRPAGRRLQARAAAIPTPVSNSVETTTGTPRAAAAAAISATATGPPTRAGFTTRTSAACLGEQPAGRGRSVDRLVGGDRDGHEAAQLRGAGRVVGGERLLRVLDAEAGDRLEPILRRRQVPGPVDVEPEADVRTHRRADRTHARDEILRLALGAGLELERREARLDRLERRLGALARGREADRPVHRHGRAVGRKGEVEAGGVDGGPERAARSAEQVELALVGQVAVARPAGRLPDDPGEDRLLDLGRVGLQDRLAEADPSVGRLEEHDPRLAVEPHPGRRGERPPERNADAERREAAHGDRLEQRAERIGVAGVHGTRRRAHAAAPPSGSPLTARPIANSSACHSERRAVPFSDRFSSRGCPKSEPPAAATRRGGS